MPLIGAQRRCREEIKRILNMRVIISKHVRKLMEGMIEKFPIWFFVARWLLLLGLASVPFAFAWSLIQ